MESSAQVENVVATAKPQKGRAREEMLRVRLSVEEAYLVDDVVKKGNFADVATATRWLFRHFDDLKQAERVINSFRQRQAAEAEIMKEIALKDLGLKE